MSLKTPMERWAAWAMTPWVILIFLSIMVFSFLYVDRSLAVLCHSMSFPGVAMITRLGLSGMYLLPLPLLALFFRYGQPNKQYEQRTWFLWFCVLIPDLVNLVLKIVFSRARPDLLFSQQWYGFYGFKFSAPFWSFPSGHATTIMGFVFALCALWPKYRYLFLLYGVLIALSRVVLTHHYLSDVMVASYLALVEVGLLYSWFVQRKWLSEPHR